jgi:hypothetical protein
LIPRPWNVPATQNAPVFVVGQAGALITFWITLAATLRGGRWRHPVVAVLAIAVLASLYPVSQQLLYLAREWLKFPG